MLERHRLNGIIAIYKRPGYIILNILILMVYYYLITSIIRYQDMGILIFNVHIWILYLLIISSSFLTTISIFSFINIRRRSQLLGTPVGALSIIAGGILGGCGCSAPLLFGLISIGITTSSLIYAIDAVSSLSNYLFLSIVIINVIFIVYYIRSIDAYYCKNRVEYNERKGERGSGQV